MFDLPINAEVFCSDGPAGRSTYVVGKPGNREITHLVVKSYLPPFREYIVPVQLMEETHHKRINLKCSRNELIKMEPFEIEEYVPTELPAYLLTSDVPDVPATPWGTMQPVNTFVPVKHQNIPPEESALRHGARVEATDGYVGQVDELLIDSNTLQVTHLVVQVGHLFDERKITIPVSQVDHLDEDIVHLNLDRQSVEKLPVTPNQHWPQ